MQFSDELIKEWWNDWPNIPDPDVYPRQYRYQFKLFLLEKGYYGCKTQSKEVAPECKDS